MGNTNSAKQTVSTDAKAASSTASTPSEVDLSHLTSQELEVIQKVMEKELTFENQEQQRAIKIEKMIKRYESTLSARIASLEDSSIPGCRLCFVPKGSAADVQICQDCNIPVCQMCGSFTADEKAKTIESTKWRCKICELKREYLCVTGRWYHAQTVGGTGAEPKGIPSKPRSLNISPSHTLAEPLEQKEIIETPQTCGDGYCSSQEGKRPPQLQVHRCESVDMAGVHPSQPDTTKLERRQSRRRLDDRGATGDGHHKQRPRSIRRLGSCRVTSNRPTVPKEPRRASFDVASTTKLLPTPPLLTRGSSERSRPRSELKTGEYRRRDSSVSPRPSRTPSLQRRCSTRRRRSETPDVQQIAYGNIDVNDNNDEEPSPDKLTQDEPVPVRVVRRRQSSQHQPGDFLLPPITNPDRRGSSSSRRSHSFRHTAAAAPEDLCIRRSSSLKTARSRENVTERRASSSRDISTMRRDSRQSSISRSRDRMMHGSKEFYPGARDSPQFSRAMARRRASTMFTTTEVPMSASNSPKSEMLHRKSSLGNPCNSFTENWLTEALRLNALSQLQRKPSDASSHASSHCVVMPMNSFDSYGSYHGLPLDSSTSLSTSSLRRLSNDRGQPQLYFNYSQPLLDVPVPGYYDNGSLSSHRSSADYTASDDPSQYSAYLAASGYTTMTHSGRSSITSTAQSESLRSSISLANSLTQALHNITGSRAAPEGQEIAGVQLGPGQAHPDSFNVSAGSIKLALKVTKGKLEIQVLSMADLNLPTTSHVMYVKTWLIHNGQPSLQKKLKLGQHCSSKHKIKYAACDIDSKTSLQVMLWAKLKKKRRRQYLGEVCLGLQRLEDEAFTAGWYTLFKHTRDPYP